MVNVWLALLRSGGRLVVWTPLSEVASAVASSFPSLHVEEASSEA